MPNRDTSLAIQQAIFWSQMMGMILSKWHTAAAVTSIFLSISLSNKRYESFNIGAISKWKYWNYKDLCFNPYIFATWLETSVQLCFLKFKYLNRVWQLKYIHYWEPSLSRKMLTFVEVKMENNLLKIDLLKLKWLNQHSCSSTEFLNQNLRQIGQVV